MVKSLALFAVALGACAGSAARPVAHAPAPSADPPVAQTPVAQGGPGKELDDTCDRTGGVVFEVDTQEKVADGTGTFVRLYRGGAVEIVHTNGELPPRTTVSCGRSATLQAISQHVAAAAWKVTPVQARCDVYATTATDYRSGGKLLWTKEVCPAGELDADSQKHLAAILAALKSESGSALD